MCVGGFGALVCDEDGLWVWGWGGLSVGDWGWRWGRGVFVIFFCFFMDVDRVSSVSA